MDSDTCRLMAAWWTTRVDAVHRYNHTSAMSRLSRAGREIEILPDPTENGPGTIQPGTLSNSVTIIHLQPSYRRLSRKIGATPPAPAPPPTHTLYRIKDFDPHLDKYRIPPLPRWTLYPGVKQNYLYYHNVTFLVHSRHGRERRRNRKRSTVFLKGRQSDQHWNSFKSNTGELPTNSVELIWPFPSE